MQCENEFPLSPETPNAMPRHLPLIALAAVAWAVCLMGIAWLGAAVLGRALSTGETVLVGVVLTVVVVIVVQARLQRDRRKIEDMRDSALW